MHSAYFPPGHTHYGAEDRDSYLAKYHITVIIPRGCLVMPGLVWSTELVTGFMLAGSAVGIGNKTSNNTAMITTMKWGLMIMS